MEPNKIIKELRDMLPPQIDYAELVSSPVPSSYGIRYVWEDPEPYVISEAADLIECLQSQLVEYQSKQQAAEVALEEMTYIIQKAAHRRCDYCIYRTEPCPARGINATCDFEYAGDCVEIE